MAMIEEEGPEMKAEIKTPADHEGVEMKSGERISIVDLGREVVASGKGSDAVVLKYLDGLR